MQKKIKRGDPLASDGFVDYVKKYKMKGGPFGDKKNSKKSRTVPKKIEKIRKGGLCSPVRFCRLP